MLSHTTAEVFLCVLTLNRSLAFEGAAWQKTRMGRLLADQQEKGPKDASMADGQNDLASGLCRHCSGFEFV
jgi:hypothetical protein